MPKGVEYNSLHMRRDRTDSRHLDRFPYNKGSHRPGKTSFYSVANKPNARRFASLINDIVYYRLKKS